MCSEQRIGNVAQDKKEIRGTGNIPEIFLFQRRLLFGGISHHFFPGYQESSGLKEVVQSFS